MDDFSIKVKNLSKCYRIGLYEKQDSISGAILNFIKSPWKNFRQYQSLYNFSDKDLKRNEINGEEQKDILWALNQVSFNVRPGEIVGIIGKNGAGKSTLLKILSRITEPTSGEAQIHGRISSLLEVGTGFHPELTGRENVYVNGTILGMTRREVSKRFDEIVNFSGVGKFIDTPVKRYSSGMQVRLAFAVAAHLQPEILIIDEVLAVGDASFQRKCLGKMDEVATSGRTILFVSHNMGAVSNLCQTGIWLEDGSIKMKGDIKDVVNAYMNTVTSDDGCHDPNLWERKGSGEAVFTSVETYDQEQNPRKVFKMGDTIVCELCIDIKKHMDLIDNIHIGIRRADTNMNILHVMSQDCGLIWENVAAGQRTLRVKIPECMLYPGNYRVALLLGSGRNQLDFIRDATGFEILENRVSKRTVSFSHYTKSAVIHTKSFWEEIDSLKN